MFRDLGQLDASGCRLGTEIRKAEIRMALAGVMRISSFNGAGEGVAADTTSVARGNPRWQEPSILSFPKPEASISNKMYYNTLRSSSSICRDIVEGP